jgi:hypothetical protein
MPIWRTGKPRSAIVRDPTIVDKGNIERSAVFDYDVGSKQDDTNELLKLVVLHLTSITNEDFNTEDTKGLI